MQDTERGECVWKEQLAQCLTGRKVRRGVCPCVTMCSRLWNLCKHGWSHSWAWHLATWAEMWMGLSSRPLAPPSVGAFCMVSVDLL